MTETSRPQMETSRSVVVMISCSPHPRACPIWDTVYTLYKMHITPYEAMVCICTVGWSTWTSCMVLVAHITWHYVYGPIGLHHTGGGLAVNCSSSCSGLPPYSEVCIYLELWASQGGCQMHQTCICMLGSTPRVSITTWWSGLRDVPDISSTDIR